MQVSKEQYEAALSETLLDGDPPRLTNAGEIVCEYGTEMALAQLELDEDQQRSVVVQHFPESVRGDLLTKAIDHYEASGLFGDEELTD